MEIERAEAIVKELLAPKYLNPPQQLVFRAAWAGRSYRDLAAAAGYDFNYIKGVGAQVWRMLSAATQQKVSKTNFRQIIESFATKIAPPPSVVEPIYSQIDWGEGMDVSAFYGRELERDRLHRWLGKDRCRLVAILGMGGMGKTTIAVELVQELQAAMRNSIEDGAPEDPDRFSYILWRSLLNAPPLKELLPELIRTLILSPRLKTSSSATGRQLTSDRLQLELMPKTVPGQIELLLEICQHHRCLIVLDNGESIFQAGARVGQYRPGYADYGDLFSTLGRMNHQSCLLLTSREKPTQISQLEGVDAKVRTLMLPGLDAVAGQQIFADRGCKPVVPIEWAEVDRYCGGNPLAFQLIAAAVQEVADGDVSEIFPYLRANKLGFADIHILLEQQWERLTSEEQQVMYWLAIGREPMPIADLETALHPAWNRQPPGNLELSAPEGSLGNSSLLTVLQSLRRRSTISNSSGIDRGRHHWSLQPMVMEYVTSKFVERICTEIEREQPLLLDTHPIAQANAKEYLRQAQLRLIVKPTLDRLRTNIGNPQHIGQHLRRILADWQARNSLQPGYLAGNILNFLIDLKLDLTDLDCSELVVRQAYLVGSDLAGVNFTNAQMVDCAFTQTFSSILAIAYHPTADTLAASDSNGDIRLWCVSDGQCLLTCSGHTNWVRSIKFSPDGRYLASSSDDRTIAIWDLQDGGVCVRTLGEGIHSLGLSFSPNGRYLASGSTNNIIYYWDLQTGQCVRQFTGHQHWSMCVCFHPQGHQLVSGSADGTVRIWDVANGKCDRVYNGHENWVTTVDYSPDGESLLSGSLDGTLRLWDATTATDEPLEDLQVCRLVLTEHGDEIWSAAFNPDGTRFASAGVGGLLRIWRTADGHCLHHLEGHHDRLWSVAFHPQGHQLASGGEDRTIRLWQISDGKCLQALNGYTNWFRSIAWTPDAQRLITASRDALVRVWSIEDRTCLTQLAGHSKSVTAVAADPQGRTFASSGDDRTIRIWDARSLNCDQILRGHQGGILALTYSPNGHYLASGGSDCSIRVWDTQRWRCLSVRTGHTDRIGGLAYHPTLDLIASASEDRTVKIWNLHDKTPLQTLSQHTNRAISVAFDPRGTILASGGMDSQVLLWDVDTGALCHSLVGHEGWILSLAYSPDGKWLFSGASDYTIKIWSMETGLCTDTLTGHQSWIWSVAVSSCARYLASASEDETIRLWDLNDGNLLSTRRAHRPYEGMNITGVQGLTKAQVNDLKTLGAQD
ncbi:WD40 repeat domain-containing protein [Chamaesiphon minutus]|uniref:WD40 repeat-containing protein n=1 Tax=Chamaesiphon minutus (strain ATCC 27169 / PCC 6605) TaxID=1173020 RepID=K9UJV0_CHAP6|nr:WD40 repeat domain-containing protein [Chamaesiphon minutus]AFY95100.1 WD40 repeat-containing protein [Chamaesiphon minutus PCC 6605]